MFVITADQIGSRTDRDRASEVIARLEADFGAAFALPPDQTSGDEIQVMMTDAQAALGVILALHRTGYWSVGIGIGGVRVPLPASTRQAAGSAFVGARSAVTRAKKADSRFALVVAAGHTAAVAVGSSSGPPAPLLDGDEVEAILSMLLLLRQRRTTEGWEAVDLLQDGGSQRDIAAALGISAAAVSQRIKSALWRVEAAVRPALVRLLENLDRATSETEPAA
ncbi:MAG TPA: DNA-binding protein [Cryobacterium sp.]|nr:DNA-binding protein [Cryobacterium sp.]